MDLKGNFIKFSEYFGFTLPLWMESRKTLFFFSFLDFVFIYFYFKKISLIDADFFDTGRYIIFGIIFCLISYLNGRYSFFREYKQILKKLYSLLRKSVLVLIAIYVIDKILIINFSNWIPLGRDDGLKILLGSYLIQSIKFILDINIFQKEFIYLIGEDNAIKKFKEYSKNISNKKKLIFRNFSEYKKDSAKFKTFILLDSNYQNKLDNFLFLISERYEVITAYRWCEKYLQRIPAEYLNKDLMDINKFLNTKDSLNWRLKRFGDIFVSFFLILITLPLIILAIFLIKLEDNGPIFYTQYRTGLYGKPFKIFKLRSMKQNSEKSGPVWAQKKDPRITNIGRVLRKSRIDELPQLFSVITGEMSLIGPRPERPEIDKTLIEEIPFYNFRNIIKPGLSGWAQVNYNYGASIKDSKIKFSYEIFYLRNYSLLLDLLILFKTLKLIINLEGSDPK